MFLLLQNHFLENRLDEKVLKKNLVQNVFEKFFLKFFDENFFTGICFSLEILMENHNKKQNFPLF